MGLVRRTDDHGVTMLLLDRPQARNALSLALLEELDAHLDALDGDAGCRVVVLAGAGPAFSAGHDLREIVEHPDPTFRERLFARCAEVMVHLVRLRQPVIARVHGVATAAGCQLVATCDLAVAGASASFGTPGVDIGLFCTTPMVALQRTVAPKHAMELLLTGERIDAEEARRIGLVNRVVPDAELDDAVGRLAATIAAKPPETVAAGKAAAWRLRELSLADAYAEASTAMATGLASPEAAEGIGAFLEKRPPVWPAP
jgi:enoyl-CoA hydratase/carnithine racemase